MYRTRNLILERFEAIRAARAAGQTYKTVLDPEPASPSLSYPAASRPDWSNLCTKQ